MNIRFDKSFIKTLRDVNQHEHEVTSNLFDSISNIRTIITLRLERSMEKGLLNKRLVGLFLGAGHESRRWPTDKFVEMAQMLASEGTGIAVLLGPEERGMRDGLHDRFGSYAVVLEEAPIPLFLALLAKMNVVVSGDTGPMHLAAVAGCAIVLLSHAGAPDIFHPLAEKLIILDETPLADIEAGTVADAVRKLL